jgi:hypothetical protein
VKHQRCLPELDECTRNEFDLTEPRDPVTGDANPVGATEVAKANGATRDDFEVTSRHRWMKHLYRAFACSSDDECLRLKQLSSPTAIPKDRNVWSTRRPVPRVRLRAVVTAWVETGHFL